MTRQLIDAGTSIYILRTSSRETAWTEIVFIFYLLKYREIQNSYPSSPIIVVVTKSRRKRWGDV